MSSSGIAFETSSNSPPPSTTSFSGEPPAAQKVGAPGRIAAGVPKFKSVPPPSLPISPPAFSPFSYFSIPGGLSPADLLDSPVLLSSSNILPSPTTGSFPFHAFNWKPSNQIQGQGIKKEHRSSSDFSFQSQSNPRTKIYEQPRNEDDLDLVKSEYPLQMQSFSPEISTIQTNSNFQKQSFESVYAADHNNHNHQSSRKKLDDGYNWRKYGQKQVKGSENPRSYYKCTYRNCSMRKKVETSLDGEVTEIVYKGNHNHPKPESIRRTSSSSVSSNSLAVHQSYDYPDQYFASHGSGQLDLVGTPENSSISIGDDEFDQSSSQRSKSGADEFDEDEHQAKRSRMDTETEGISMGGSRTVREPRVVVQTVSDIDILDDGYRWRKYGQKVVKGNPNPRSYYKCTTPGCSVRKHVERASHDLKSVITTYEGKHNHDVPVARGGHRLPATNPDNNVTTMTIRPLEMSTHQPNDPMINPIRGSRLPLSSDYHTPFTLEMLHSPEGFGFSGFDNPMHNRQPNSESVFSKAKEEPKDDMFLESLLC